MVIEAGEWYARDWRGGFVSLKCEALGCRESAEAAAMMGSEVLVRLCRTHGENLGLFLKHGAYPDFQTVRREPRPARPAEPVALDLPAYRPGECELGYLVRRGIKWSAARCTCPNEKHKKYEVRHG